MSELNVGSGTVVSQVGQVFRIEIGTAGLVVVEAAGTNYSTVSQTYDTEIQSVVAELTTTVSSEDIDIQLSYRPAGTTPGAPVDLGDPITIPAGDSRVVVVDPLIIGHVLTAGQQIGDQVILADGADGEDLNILIELIVSP